MKYLSSRVKVARFEMGQGGRTLMIPETLVIRAKMT